MLAAKMYGKNDIRLEDVSVPELKEGEILLKVKAAAICGTDIRMIKNGHESISEKTPRILGHEISGIIAKTKASEYKEGMRISVAPNTGCGLCNSCISGQSHLCKDYEALGISIDGGFAEYTVIPSKYIKQGNISILPDSVSFEEAAVNEPLSCVYSGFERCNIRPGDSVLIIGAGPIGIMHGMLALLAGASKVYINDLSEERLNKVKEVNDRLIIVRGNPEDSIKEVNVCITACPSPEAQALALRICSLNGRINFFGGIAKSKEPCLIDTNLIHYKQLIVSGTARSSIAQYRKTLSFIEEGILDIKPIITGRYELKNINEAIDNAAKVTGLKNVLVF